MKHTVTFAKPYDHPTSDGHIAYPAGYSGEVSQAVIDGATAKGALKGEPATDPKAK